MKTPKLIEGTRCKLVTGQNGESVDVIYNGKQNFTLGESVHEFIGRGPSTESNKGPVRSYRTSTFEVQGGRVATVIPSYTKGLSFAVTDYLPGSEGRLGHVSAVEREEMLRRLEAQRL